MKFNPESQNNENNSNLAFEQIEHVEEVESAQEGEENVKLEEYFDDGFGDKGDVEVVLNSNEDIKAFESIYGVSIDSILEKRHGNAA